MEHLEDVESDDAKSVSVSVGTALQYLDVAVVHTKNMLDDYGQKWFHTLEQFETNHLFARARNPELDSIAAGPGIFNPFKRQVNAYGQFAAYKSACSKLIPKVVDPSKTDWRSAARPPRPNPKDSRLRSKWRPLLPHVLKRAADMVVRLAHPQLPPSRQLPSSHERLRALKCSFFSGKKEHRA